MGCNKCEKIYRQNLDHIRILAKQCAELLQVDQVIYKVNGRIWHYDFSEKAAGEYIETVQFDRKPTDIKVFPDNENTGLLAFDSSESTKGKSKRFRITPNMVENIGRVLPSGESEEV